MSGVSLLSDEDRFMYYAQITEKGCWIWHGYISPTGYGYFNVKDSKNRFKWRGVLAHRWSYLHFIGPIPDGMEIDHLCRVRFCVNPDHLDLVTRLENSRRTEQFMKDYCVNGHLRSEENTYQKSNGTRRCRICNTAAQRRRQEKLNASK